MSAPSTSKDSHRLWLHKPEIVVSEELKPIPTYTPLTRYREYQLFIANEGWHMSAAAAALQDP